MEIGWLLDNCNRQLCIGSDRRGNFLLVPYTDLKVIRFARFEDAERTRIALARSGSIMLVKDCKPIEHSWG